MHQKYHLIVLSFVILVLYFSSYQPSHAQSESPGISVVPSIARVDLQTDASQLDIIYKNTTSDSVDLYFSASDFTELEDGYKMSFLEKKDAQNYKYALSSWLTFDKQFLALQPQESGTVTVFINKNELTPGGHYGTILAQIQKKDTAGQVQIQGILSSLIFVRTATGKETEEGTLEDFIPQRSLFGFPTSFIMRFHNSGDTDVIPHGVIEITNTWNKEVARGIVNENSLISLPESIRKFEIPIVTLQPFLFPGIYHANLMVHFGKTNKKVYSSATFFSQGSIPVIPFGILLIVAILLLRKFYKNNKHKIIEKN